MKLSQKEISYLKDQLEHEKICIKKYNNYAAQLQDTELSQMFYNLAQKEEQHAQTITKFLEQAGVQTQQF